MKKIAVILTSLVLLLTPVLVSAEDNVESTSSSKSVRFRQETNTREEVKERIRAKVSEEGEELKGKLEERRKAIVKKFFVTMLKRLDAASARLEKLIERIENRIVKIKEENPALNLSAQETQVNSAKAKLSEVAADIEALPSEIDNLLNSEEPLAAFKEVKEKISDIKDQLKEIHRILVKVIGELKGLRVGDND